MINDLDSSRWRTLNWNVFEGEFLNNMAHGFGYYIHSDGSEYKGEWRHNKPHGRGEETWPDGTKYKGEFVNGK